MMDRVVGMFTISVFMKSAGRQIDTAEPLFGFCSFFIAWQYEGKRAVPSDTVSTERLDFHPQPMSIRLQTLDYLAAWLKKG